MKSSKLLKISPEVHARLVIQSTVEQVQMSEIANKILSEHLNTYTIKQNIKS